MRTPDVFVHAIGTWVPDTVTTAWAVEHGLYDARELDVHGLESVAIAGDTPAPEMGLRAARQALERGGHDGASLDLLLYAATWHQGPEGWLAHSYLQHHLVGDVRATEVRQGCNGMFTALELAACHLRAEPQRRAALLVAADNYGGPMVDRWRMGRGYVGGDAASAVVLGTDPGFARLLAVDSVTVPEAEEMHRGDNPLFPPGITAGRGLDFTASNDSFTARARTTAGGTAPLLRVALRTSELVEDVLGQAGVTASAVTRVALMNYSKDVVEQQCAAALGAGLDRSVWELGNRLGHCGCSDQVLALDHLLATGQLEPGDTILMLGTGPGVMVAAAVVEIVDAPSWTVEEGASRA